MEVQKIRRVIRKVMRGKERITVIVGKGKTIVIYHDNIGWHIGNAVIAKLASYSYFRYLIKREFGKAIKGSQIRWLYSYLKRKHIKKSRLGTVNDTPNLLKRREKRIGEDWGRWENRQLLRLGEGGKGLIEDIYEEEFMGRKVFLTWSPRKEENLGGGGNLLPVGETSTTERGTGEGKEVGYGNHFG